METSAGPNKLRWLKISGLLLLIIGGGIILFIVIDPLGLLTFAGGGRLHVDVIFPAETTTTGEQWTRAAVDAHDRPSGDMTYAVTLPDGKTVYCTRDGYLGLEELLEQNAKRIKAGGVSWLFKVKEDTIWDKMAWRYYSWAGSRAGHPEGARGKP